MPAHPLPSPGALPAGDSPLPSPSMGCPARCRLRRLFSTKAIFFQHPHPPPGPAPSSSFICLGSQPPLAPAAHTCLPAQLPQHRSTSLLRKVEAKQGQGRVRPPGKVLSATTKGPRLLHKRSSRELVVGRSAEAIYREQHGCLSLCSLHFYTQSTPIRRQAHAFAVEFTRPGSQRCIAPPLLSWIYFL